MKITKELLYLQYITLHKSSEVIGKELGCSGRNIRYLLKSFGFDSEMKIRRQTASIGKEPSNKGKIRTSTPKLGRYYISCKGRAVPRYRHIMEQHLGRKLARKEIIHHKDGNPLNDSIENLEIMTQSEHIKLHNPIITRWSKLS